MRLIETRVYRIEEHPDREACYRWIRTNWEDLTEHNVCEVADSIKALSEKIGGTHKYCICPLSDPREYVIFEDFSRKKLNALNPYNCPLTGVCWDIDLITGLREGNPDKVLEALHRETEYQYSDEGLFDMCMANEYEFDESGVLAAH
jgi:hypothetical protein